MLDALSLLVIAFIVMTVVSVIGVVLLYLIKNEKVKKGIFYFLVVWGLVITYCGVRSTPLYMADQVLITCIWGVLAVVALLIQLCMKKENRFNIARILVTISVVAGMIDCFMF